MLTCDISLLLANTCSLLKVNHIVRLYNNDPLNEIYDISHVVKEGALEFVKWLFDNEIYELPAQEYLTDYAVAGGHLNIIKYYKLTIMPRHVNYAIKHNRFKLAKYIYEMHPVKLSLESTYILLKSQKTFVWFYNRDPFKLDRYHIMDAPSRMVIWILQNTKYHTTKVLLNIAQYHPLYVFIEATKYIKITSAVLDCCDISKLYWICKRNKFHYAYIDQTMYYGRLNCIKLLHKYGIKLKCGLTTLNSTLMNGHMDVLSWIKDNNIADFTSQNVEYSIAKSQYTSLNWFAINRPELILKHFIHLGDYCCTSILYTHCRNLFTRYDIRLCILKFGNNFH